MTFTPPRPYRSDKHDLPRMLELLRQRWLMAEPHPDDMHLGDLLWARYQHEDDVYRWFDRVLLWERGDQLLGFAIFYPKTGEVGCYLASALDGNTELIGTMLDAARKVAEIFGSDPPLTAAAFAGTALERALQALGGRLIEGPFYRMNGRILSSDEALEAPLPVGWQVRPVSGPAEYERRVEVHRASFASSKVTVSAYARMREMPGYDPELDLVAVGPDGEIASFALAWFDAETSTGLFEPVGSLPAFRRRGLTHAVMIEGLRRLRARGVTHAYVNCLEASEAAVGLYESVGFRQLQRLRSYTMPER